MGLTTFTTIDAVSHDGYARATPPMRARAIASDRFWFRLGTGRMPQVKGQALHVRMRNRGDNTWFTCVRWCTRSKALTQLQFFARIENPGYAPVDHDLTYTIMFSAGWHCWVFCLEMMTFSYERASPL